MLHSYIFNDPLTNMSTDGQETSIFYIQEILKLSLQNFYEILKKYIFGILLRYRRWHY